MLSTGMIVGTGVFALVLILLLWIERWPWTIVRLSTLQALKWLGLGRTITGGAHGVFYARWGPRYVLILKKLAGIFGERGKHWMEETYHGKVLTPELANAIITIEEDVPLQELGKRVIPFDRAREIFLDSSTSIVVTDCVCKRGSHDLKKAPCKLVDEPYQVCMFVGNPSLCDFLIDHKPKTSYRLSKEEALEVLKFSHEKGLVHNAWFKDCIKDQFYVICNCCPCCCLGFDSMKYGINQLVSSGYVATVDEDRCSGCGTCKSICPFQAVEIVESKDKSKSVVQWEKCYGCSVCVDKCKKGARSLELDEKKGLPLYVRTLTKT